MLSLKEYLHIFGSWKLTKRYICFKFPFLFSDKQAIMVFWDLRMDYPLNLENPQTFNEKLQWMKLYDRKDLYTTLVDKYAVKEYVSQKIGSEYIIPTIGVWNKVKEIDWDNLPQSFVLKCTHDSGGLVICRDKKFLDIHSASNKLDKSLKTDYYKLGREWVYKNVPHRIIAEQFMEDKETGELRDYKFFCFNGRVKWLFIATDRQNREEPYFDFFDMDFNHLPIKSGHPNSPKTPEKPKCFEEMKSIAATLSKGLPHIRVDLYEVNGKVYFGELTFYHHAGTVPFEPKEWDYIFGKEIELPTSDK